MSEPDRDRMLTLAAEAADAARAAGADFADAAVHWGRHVAVGIDGGEVRACEQHERMHHSVRAFVGGGMGSADGDGPADGLADRGAPCAVELARQGGRDPDFVDLPAAEAGQADEDALDLYDPAVAALGPADAVRIARECIARAAEADPGVTINGEVSFSAGWSVLASAGGVRAARRHSFAEVSLFAVARDGDDVGSFADYTMGRHWADLAVEPLAARVVAAARGYQHARPCPSRAMTLLLAPPAAGGLLGTLASAASAESIRRKRSMFTGRQGRAVAADLLTLADRPLEPRGLYSGALDGEGAPRQPVVVIDRGVFARPLTNHYNARLAGVANTGHGNRHGSVAPTNLHATPGPRTEAELIAEIDDGVYLQAGSLDPEPASGDFSTVLDFAFKIDRGRLTYPLAGGCVAGNLFELLGRLDGVSSDFRADPGQRIPALRFASVSASGGQ